MARGGDPVGSGEPWAGVALAWDLEPVVAGDGQPRGGAVLRAERVADLYAAAA